MANPLTGDFEAVVQISVRQVNGLLATLHQNGANQTSPLRLLHSLRARIGDPKRPDPGTVGVGDWVLEYQSKLPSGPRPPVPELVATTVPPGLAKRLADVFADLDLELDPNPPDLVRGRAEIQASTVRVSIENGATSEITVEADVRARYFPDPSTSAVPAPLHGTIRAAFEVRRTQLFGVIRLVVRASSQDQKIDFLPSPASGLSSADAQKIAKEVRRFLRDGIELLPVDLPSGFPFSEFKGVGSGPSAAFALPLQISGAPPPASGVQGITQSIVGNAGFAFAVSEAHVRSMIDVEAIREGIRQNPLVLTVSVLGFSGSVTYHLRFSSGPTLTFEQGAMVISGRVEAETSTWWAPNGFVEFSQRFTLELSSTSQAVNPRTVGAPEVDCSWFIPTSIARNVVRNEVRNALRANAPAIRKVFRDAKNGLVSALRSFEPSAGADYTGISISTAGVTVRGDVSSAARIGPIIQVEPTDGGAAFSALESWIPGGSIARFDWSWIEYPGEAAFPWGGVVRFASEVSRFTLDKPPGIDSFDRLCLRVHGTRILPDGSSMPVSGGAACQIQEPVITFDAPSWFDPLMVPVWQPGSEAGSSLDESIAAHVSVQSDRPTTRAMQNAVIFFPDMDVAAPFDVLARALQSSRRPESRLAVFIVLPEGAFAASRREVESRLEHLRSVGRFQVTEDVQGGWSRTFGVSKRPTLFVVNARRRFAVQEADRMDPSAIADTIDQHILPAPTRAFRPLRLSALAGAAAPDFSFALDGEDPRALHRMRGRGVIVGFFQLWSKPCMRELRRLDALAGKGRADLLILALYGGAAAVDTDAFRKEHGLSIPLIHDAEHRVARSFGVRCWPTTVTVDPELRIEHVQFGIETDDRTRQAAS